MFFLEFLSRRIDHDETGNSDISECILDKSDNSCPNSKVEIDILVVSLRSTIDCMAFSQAPGTPLLLSCIVGFDESRLIWMLLMYPLAQFFFRLLNCFFDTYPEKVRSITKCFSNKVLTIFSKSGCKTLSEPPSINLNTLNCSNFSERYPISRILKNRESLLFE